MIHRFLPPTHGHQAVSERKSQLKAIETFTSTSVDPESAFHKVKTDDDLYDICCRIRVPKGSRALYIGPGSLHPTENELILPRGGKFVITGIERGTRGYEKFIWTYLDGEATE